MTSTYKKFAILFAVFCCVAVASLYVAYRIQAARQLADIESDQRQIVEIGAYRLDIAAGVFSSDVCVLSTEPSLQNWLATQDASARRDIERTYLSFAVAKPDYDQIRFIDTNGMEVVRIERTADGLVALAPEMLSDKSNRYYVAETLKLEQGQLFVSEVDLNIERGVVEPPAKPTLRVATPVHDADGRRRGLVIINVGAGKMLEGLRALSESSEGQSWLLNHNGYWLVGPREKEWAFMYPDRTGDAFSQAFPSAWGTIVDGPATGQFLRDGNMFTYNKLTLSGTPRLAERPVPGKPQSAVRAADPWSWVFLTYVPETKLAELRANLSRGFIAAGALLVPFLGGVAFTIARLVDYRSQLEQKRVELEISERGKKFADLIIESSPLATVVADTDGQVMQVNRLVEEVFGYPRQELIGQPVEMLLPKRLAQYHATLRRQNPLAVGPARRMGADRLVLGRRKDGSEIVLDVGLGRFDIGGQTNVIATITDITLRKMAEEKIKLVMRDLTRSNAELEQFAYIASHDLQEPLRTVGGMLHLLRDRYKDQLDKRAEEFIGHSVEGAQRMQRLIDDLLTYSRVGRQDMPIEAIDCNALLSEVTKGLAASIAESEATVSWESLPIVSANRSLIFLLFQNLVGNAIKFRGDRVPKVTVSAVTVGEHPEGGESWRFTVRDNGIGIEPKFHEEVFKVFRRLHTRAEYSGTGIGLAICRRIIERHGGKIWVESKPGEGSAFKFELRKSA